jgi:hypothetical protein
MIATYPVGGVAWDYGQYLLGLQDLGFEVYYIEDTGSPTYDPAAREYSERCNHAISYLANALKKLSPALASRWHFKSCTNESFGLSEAAIRQLMADADLFLNVSGGTLLRDEYMANRCKVLIDSDPGWNHFVNFPRWDANPGWQESHGYRAHDHFFTYAERMGADDCLLPDFGIDWKPTRPVVSPGEWRPQKTAAKWTTVMTWNNFQKPVEYDGRLFGTKELEFSKIERLPRQCGNESFELAVGGAHPPVERWREFGWNVVDSHSVSTSADIYRNYIQSSRGEISVAKNLYVATKSGWFSCRSACYLAAGRPVVLQDTGYSNVIPTGEGLFAFQEESQAVQAIETVAMDYERHSDAARGLAREYLAADRVLRDLLSKVGYK